LKGYFRKIIEDAKKEYICGPEKGKSKLVPIEE
jgi:hypothetical protein